MCGRYLLAARRRDNPGGTASRHRVPPPAISSVMRLDDGGRQSLRQVVPIGVELDLEGEHQLFLLAVYLWRDHSDVGYATTDPPVRGRPIRKVLEDWTASDDLGNRYLARRGDGGGGHIRLMRRTFVPALDHRARSLTLTYTEDGIALVRHTVILPPSWTYFVLHRMRSRRCIRQ